MITLASGALVSPLRREKIRGDDVAVCEEEAQLRRPHEVQCRDEATLTLTRLRRGRTRQCYRCSRCELLTNSRLRQLFQQFHRDVD